MAEREDKTGEYSFDELAKGVADGNLSRSGALKSVGAAILGAVLSMFALPRNAEAADLKTLWAVVNEDGTLQRGKGVMNARKLATGEYVVKFKQDVNKCAWSASLQNNSGFVFLDTILNIDNEPRLATPREVGVTTTDRGGILRDTPFHLIVQC